MTKVRADCSNKFKTDLLTFGQRNNFSYVGQRIHVWCEFGKNKASGLDVRATSLQKNLYFL